MKRKVGELGTRIQESGSMFREPEPRIAWYFMALSCILNPDS
jgi:hypothetical protein